MEPTLPKASVVWATRDPGSAVIGDVVLLEGRSGWIVHRLLWFSAGNGKGLLFHRGDFEGGIGICPSSAIRGRVVAMIEPDRIPLLPFQDLSVAFRWRFRLAQARCRVYLFCFSLASCLGLEQTRSIRAMGRILRKVLL